MIEINLLPQELKVKGIKFDIEFIRSKKLLSFILPAFGLLICIHIYLCTLAIIKNYQFHRLNRKWQNLKPQREILEEFKKEYDVSSTDAKTIQKLLGQRVNWAEKLNKLSINLPAGVWFNELGLTKKELTLKGAVISVEKQEISLINQFMDNLKNDAGFLKDFNALELGTVQRKTIAGYDIVEFILKGTLK